MYGYALYIQTAPDLEFVYSITVCELLFGLKSFQDLTYAGDPSDSTLVRISEFMLSWEYTTYSLDVSRGSLNPLKQARLTPNMRMRLPEVQALLY